MKNKMYKSFIYISLLALTSCGNNYGTFIEVTDEDEKENLVDRVSQDYSQAQDMDKCEIYLTYPASSQDEEERYTAIKGKIKDGKIYTDLLEINDGVGAVYTYVRFSEEYDSYYTYKRVKFTRIDSDSGAEENIDYKLKKTCNYFDSDKYYSSVDLQEACESDLIDEVSFLSAFRVVPISDMDVFFSEDGFYKIGLTVGNYYTCIIFDAEGKVQEIESDNKTEGTKYFNCDVSYSTLMDGVDEDSYDVSDSEKEDIMDDYIEEFWTM